MLSAAHAAEPARPALRLGTSDTASATPILISDRRHCGSAILLASAISGAISAGVDIGLVGSQASEKIHYCDLTQRALEEQADIPVREHCKKDCV